MNIQNLEKKIKKIANENLKKTFIADSIKEGFKLKDKLISEFLNHPVTIELNSGPNSYVNVSGTLKNFEGNLYSFIGFESGTDPIKPILDVLLKINIFQQQVGDNLFLVVNGFPTPQEIWDITPMPWQDGRSWAKGIEEGISGLNYYLFSFSKNFPTSRSGPAIQTKKQIFSGARFERVKYISTMLNKYKVLFKNLMRKKQITQSFFV